MRRYTLINLHPLFKICLHKIAGEDTVHLHNHPWSYVSVVLKGAHKEHHESHTLVRKPFSVAYREHDRFHRLETINGQPSWTLVFMGPRRHAWGFLKNGLFMPHESRIKD